MEELLTTVQLALRAGTSGRTIQRWIAQGKLKAQRVSEFDNRYLVETDDLLALRLRDHREEESRLQTLERQMRALTEQVAKLDAMLRVLAEQLHHVTTLTPKTTPRHHLRVAEHTSVALAPNTAGRVPAMRFAEMHGMSRDAAKSAYKRQYIKTTKVQGDQAHYLDEQQRRDALAYWCSHNTPGFATCGDPGCSCHE